MYDLETLKRINSGKAEVSVFMDFSPGSPSELHGLGDNPRKSTRRRRVHPPVDIDGREIRE